MVTRVGPIDLMQQTWLDICYAFRIVKCFYTGPLPTVAAVWRSDRKSLITWVRQVLGKGACRRGS